MLYFDVTVLNTQHLNEMQQVLVIYVNELHCMNMQYPSPEWDTVTPEAKSLINSMLTDVISM